MSTRDVFVVGAARTAIGTFGGSLKDIPLSDVATLAVKTALERSGAPADAVGHLAMGTVIPDRAARCLPEPRRRRAGRPAQGDCCIQREPPVRLGAASHHLVGAIHSAG